MIEPMAKAFVAVRREQRERLLTRLRELGVLHLVPAQTAGEDEHELARTASRARRALQALKEVTPAGEAPEGTAGEIAARILELQRHDREARSLLASLEDEAREAAVWGRVTKERIAELEQHGVTIHLVQVADADLPALPGSVLAVTPSGKHRSLAICLGGAVAAMPTRATVLTPPDRDLPSIEAEMAEVRDVLAEIPGRLAHLALRGDDLAGWLHGLEDRLSLNRAMGGGLAGESLYGVQGWLPLARAASLSSELRAAGIAAGVHVRPAAPGERPPTLVRYPRALRPIRALFDLLGVRPGYDEADPTGFFMVAVPLFAGMLISDAGYGLVLLSASLIALRGMRPPGARDAFHLVAVFGAAALVWGAISGSWFGVTPTQIQRAGGLVGTIGSVLYGVQFIRGTEQVTRDTLIKICFLLGSTHLILAHLRRVMALAPDPAALADLGWCGVLAAMLGVIWNLFFREAPLSPGLTHGLLGAGAVGFLLVAAFSAPDPNPLVRVGKGIGGGLFPLIGAFGDTLSYIRLAAVGLASFYLAVAIDTLAAEAAAAGTWLAGAPILVLGHTLNMTLSLVAVLAHGVRLNLLEFSSHAGLQWAGYPYRPFAGRAAGER